MKILWINPSFLDYRIPVYDELNKLANYELKIIFSAEEHRTPKRVVEKVNDCLNSNAIGLKGEKTFILGNKNSSLANKHINIPYQPGIIKKVLNTEADVIIVEGYFQWSPIGYLKKIIQKKPIVLSYERTFHTERNSGKLRFFYRKLLTKYFDAAVVNGRLSKEYLASLGMPLESIFTGGMAADSSFFRERTKNLEKITCKKEWNFNYNSLIYLYVGQIVERKGVMELLNAWKHFDKEATLVCAGMGNQMQEVQEYLKLNNLNNVIMLGSVDYDRLPSLYKASDVFIIPTLEDNWSLVVPEAMASGLPIACSKYNGLWPELIHDNVNGKVFDPLDAEDTLECLEYFYKNKERLEYMGKDSIEIEKEFSPKNAAKSIYNACLKAFDNYEKN